MYYTVLYTWWCRLVLRCTTDDVVLDTFSYVDETVSKIRTIILNRNLACPAQDVLDCNISFVFPVTESLSDV